MIKLSVAEDESFRAHVVTGCRNPRHVALTFDDGISDYTNELLEILKRYRVQATFFVLGQTLETNNFFKKTLIRMVREGHVVASHSYNHPDLTSLSKNQIRDQMERTEVSIQSIIGIRPRLMRPPYGYVNHKVVETLKSLGYVIINWNHDTNDWRHQDSYGNIVGYVQNQISFPHFKNEGPIILQHDSLRSSIQLQSGIIRILQGKGYEFVSMYECIGEEPYRY